MSAIAPGAPRRDPVRVRHALLWVWAGIVGVFLFTPIVTSIVYSFNLGVNGRQTSAFTGWTASWYAAAVETPSLGKATATSLEAAFWVAVISTVIGTMLGYAIVRHPSRAVRGLLTGLTYALLIVPETVLGVALLLMYGQTHIPLSFWTLVAGHSPLSISVVAYLVRARLLTLEPGIEEAAADLGASPIRVLRLVVLPQLLPAIAAAALLAYTFSFDNVVISSFLSTATLGTLPVYLYGTLQYGATPAVYATTTMVTVGTLLVMGIVAVLLRRTLWRSPRPAA